MFKDLKRAVYQVADMEKAKQWYGAVLEKKPAIDLPFAVVFQVGDSHLVLVPKENPASEGHSDVPTYWAVDDVDRAYQHLLQSGAVSHKAVDIVWNLKRASVLDPFGNVLGIIGSNPEANRGAVEQRASGTAMGVTFLRALGAMDPREEIRSRDYLAEKFLGPDHLKALHDPAARKEMTKQRMAPGIYEYMLARTAFFDHLVETALKESIPQIVFLGAGYDTRPYRFRELIKEARLFELDIHTTQQNKKKLLQKADIPIPEQLTFVPMNFNTDRLADNLLKAGFRKTDRTLYIWEGVIYYLQPSIVDQTLDSITAISSPGSTIAFDYASRFPDMMEAYGVKALAEIMRAQAAGEPIGLMIERGNIEVFLSERGYRIIEHYTAAEMERKYLTLKDGSLAGKMTGHVCFAYASIAV
jgi:methyltransferase (TIGR00027 family)